MQKVPFPGCCKGVILRDFGQVPGLGHVHGQTTSKKQVLNWIRKELETHLHRTEYGPASGKIVVCVTTQRQTYAIESLRELGFIPVGDPDHPTACTSWTMTKEMWATLRETTLPPAPPKKVGGPARDAAGRFCKASDAGADRVSGPSASPVPAGTGNSVQRSEPFPEVMAPTPSHPEGLPACPPGFDVPDGTAIRAAYRQPIYAWYAYQGYAVVWSEYEQLMRQHPGLPEPLLLGGRTMATRCLPRCTNPNIVHRGPWDQPTHVM